MTSVVEKRRLSAANQELPCQATNGYEATLSTLKSVPTNPNLSDLPRNRDIFQRISLHQQQIRYHPGLNTPSIMQAPNICRKPGSTPQSLQRFQTCLHQQLQLLVHTLAEGRMSRPDISDVSVRATQYRYPSLMQLAS